MLDFWPWQAIQRNISGLSPVSADAMTIGSGEWSANLISRVWQPWGMPRSSARMSVL
jgi:hypothetical protein